MTRLKDGGYPDAILRTTQLRPYKKPRLNHRGPDPIKPITLDEGLDLLHHTIKRIESSRHHPQYQSAIGKYEELLTDIKDLLDVVLNYAFELEDNDNYLPILYQRLIMGWWIEVQQLPDIDSTPDIDPTK